ncbi:TetR/AcrR family transcriptional regulator [Schleiferilactobacillus perolens]|uniref:TetR/AcrR family transcriptional regulator n=1 Tax=Schleiferilactobacillus perolens TaxID=100468 RepID=UPI002352E411|nr:TetR/AcrR family transcriptional regulator [Schleiferilactobacillus perolens]MCI2170553.1 TetR/AcrR family transcriptional regulator [Schleiferilactobacillus perolens]
MPRQILSSKKIIQQAVILITHDQTPTFSNIAREMGTRSQALYVYFANQDQLRGAIFLWALGALSDTLKNQLFGLSGRPAIERFAQVCRTVGLQNIRLARFVLTTPRHLQDNTAHQTVTDLNGLLMQLCATYSDKKNDQIIIARTLRNLIVGEIVNVGAGWFHNPTVSAADSFNQMITNYLDTLSAG